MTAPKRAVTVLAASIVTVHSNVVPVQAPSQRTNCEPGAAAGVSVTTVPCLSDLDAVRAAVDARPGCSSPSLRRRRTSSRSARG